MYDIVVSDVKSAQETVFQEHYGDRVSVRTASARTPEAVIDVASEADAIVVDANTPITEAVLAALDLQVVGRSGIGVDNIDLEAAARHEVTVVHVPEYCLEEVSTNAVALFLACVRSIPTYDRSTTAGEWGWEVGRPIHRLRGQTLGLFAFGDIARRAARKFDGFGMELLAYDPYLEDAVFEEHGVRRVSFETLVAESDHLSIHAPLTEDTRGAIDESVLEALPAHAVVVNNGRGGIVDESALLDALDAGSIAAAGLDVLAEEPPSDPAILEHERTIVTPHSAWYSEESIQELVETVARDVLRVLEGETPENPVDAEWS